MEKTNVDFIRDILEELKNPCGDDFKNEKVEEALEFLTEVEDELNEYDTTVSSLRQEVKDLEDEEPDEAEYDNSDFLGLDTLHWSLESGNLIVMDQLATFISQIKKQNGAGE